MKIKAKLLLAENDYNFATSLTNGLSNHGYIIDRFQDGELAWNAFNKTQYDLCLLDTVLPRRNGYTLASHIRIVNERVPIILLSEKFEDQDRLLGYRAGADNFLNKSFALEELVLRIEVLLKRTMEPIAETFAVGKCLFDPIASTIRLSHGKIIRLTERERKLLTFLCLHANKTI